MALVLPPMYLLLLGALLVVLFGGARTVWLRSTRPLVWSFPLAGVFFGLFYLQAWMLFWTID